VAKKVGKRLEHILTVEYATPVQISDLYTNGKRIVRDTFKRYVDLEQLTEIEEKLGYSNKHGGRLAKDNSMIEYWKYNLGDFPGDVMVYKPTEVALFVFALSK
jgi:hypothetical protein